MKGRPTKYLEEYIETVDKYLAKCQDIYDEFHKTRGEKSDSYERILKVDLPTVEGFAAYIGVVKSSVYEWAKQHPDFSNALDKIMDEQRHRLLNNGLAGNYNPLIAKLVLSANHGMREKSDITSDDKPIQANTVVFADYDQSHSESK